MWSKFWSGLNIRKFISLAFTLTFCVASIIVIHYGINSSNVEIILAGTAGLSSILSSCIGYYFGYSNGLSNKKVEEKLNQDNIEDSL